MPWNTCKSRPKLPSLLNYTLVIFQLLALVTNLADIWTEYVMVNLMYQFDKAKRCPESWQNIIYGYVCDRVSWKAKNPNLIWMNNKDLPSPMQVGTIHSLRAQKKQKGSERVNSYSFYLPPSPALSTSYHSLFPLHLSLLLSLNIRIPGSPVFKF